VTHQVQDQGAREIRTLKRDATSSTGSRAWSFKLAHKLASVFSSNRAVARSQPKIA